MSNFVEKLAIAIDTVILFLANFLILSPVLAKWTAPTQDLGGFPPWVGPPLGSLAGFIVWGTLAVVSAFVMNRAKKYSKKGNHWVRHLVYFHSILLLAFGIVHTSNFIGKFHLGLILLIIASTSCYILYLLGRKLFG